LAFDALALHAIRDELDDAVLGARIDSVSLLDERTICLEVYAQRKAFVVISANPSDPRMYVTQDRPRRGTDAVTPLLLLMRKYVRGGRITAIDQPRLERMLTIQVSTRIDEGPPHTTELVSELMGRRSNVVLVDEDGAILDALIRLPPSVNPSRPLLPHLRYVRPSPELKSDPLDPALGDILQRRAQSSDGEAWRLIVSTVAGFSPLASQEAIVRAGGQPSTQVAQIESWNEVAAAIHTLAAPIESHEWNPSIAWIGAKAREYAPYVLTQFPEAEVRPYPSMSDVIIQIGGAERARKALPFATLRRPLLDAIADRTETLRRKRSSLERSLAMADRADSLREAGEAILANASQIQEGDASLTWEGRRIDLYPSLSAIENAQSYFRQYTDARDAKRVVPPLLEGVEAEIGYLDDMALHVEDSESEREISALRRELEDVNVISRARPSKKGSPAKASSGKAQQQQGNSGVVRRLSIDGADLLVGASAAGNESVTFRLARPEDLWFHARGRPGAHVILRAEGRTVQDHWIEIAAGIAAAQSAGRDEGHVEVDYVQRKYVRKISGALPGRVTYRHETTITVAPVSATETRQQRKTG